MLLMELIKKERERLIESSDKWPLYKVIMEGEEGENSTFI